MFLTAVHAGTILILTFNFLLHNHFFRAIVRLDRLGVVRDVFLDQALFVHDESLAKRLDVAQRLNVLFRQIKLLL